MDEYQLGATVTLIYLIVSIGLGAAAYVMAQKAMKGADMPDMEGTTTLAKRGALLPLVIGKRLVPPTFAFARDLGVVWDQNTSWSQRKAGWHHICVGPVKAIHNIIIDGTPLRSDFNPSVDGLNNERDEIFPLTPATYPSGTSLSLPKLGTTYIFWGEVDQPVDLPTGGTYDHWMTGSALSEETGVASRWPHVCSLYYVAAPFATIWPQVLYETETEVQQPVLTRSSSYIPATYSTTEYIERTHTDRFYPTVLTATGETVLTVFLYEKGIFSSGTTDLGWIPRVGDSFKVVGTNLLDINTVYTITKLVWSYNPSTFFHKWVKIRISTTINLTDVIFASNAYIRLYKPGRDDGYNLAHMIGQVLFADFPHGLAQQQVLFDMDSLEDLGILCESERLAGGVSITEGQTAEAVLTELLQDIGCLLPLDPHTGKYKFVPIRDPSSSVVPHVNEDLLLPPLPEVTALHRVKASSRILYVFADREHQYKDMTIGGHDNNGEMQRQEYARAKKIPIATVTDFSTASTVSNRRSQEDLGSGAVYTIRASREARLISPGRPFSVEGFEQQLLCTSTEIKPLEEYVTLTAVSNYYGVAVNTTRTEPGDTDVIPPPLPPHIDASDHPIEVPAYLKPFGPQSIAVSRIRAHPGMQGARVWISIDNVSYKNIGSEASPSAGGLLSAALPDDSTYLLEEGPAFLDIGVDLVNRTQFLDSDYASWRRGSQILAIGTELCFVRSLEFVVDDTWRLKGIIRARYGTSKQSHTIGSAFHLFDIDDLTQHSDSIISPGVQVWVKVQPHSAVSSVTLESCVAYPLPLYGNSIVPARPNALRVEGNSNYYEAGVDSSFKWSYTSGLLPNTGGGTVNAGAATSTSPLVGTFEITVLTSADVEVTTYTSTTNSWTYAHATRNTDLSGDPASFKLQVRNVSGGYKSDPDEISVEKI